MRTSLLLVMNGQARTFGSARVLLLLRLRLLLTLLLLACCGAVSQVAAADDDDDAPFGVDRRSEQGLDAGVEPDDADEFDYGGAGS